MFVPDFMAVYPIVVETFHSKPHVALMVALKEKSLELLVYIILHCKYLYKIML